MTSAQLVGHETLEGYYESTGVSRLDAHLQTNAFFPGFNQTPQPENMLIDQKSGNVLGITATAPIAGMKVTERFYMYFDTPIPRAEFGKRKGGPYPSYPKDVEVKKP